jgi:hypothetical protein
MCSSSATTSTAVSTAKIVLQRKRTTISFTYGSFVSGPDG